MFHLPQNTKIQKVIPKNAFDNYTNTKQKKSFTDKVQRITWANKIAFDTVNLNGIDVSEIQLFKILLKEKTVIKDLLSIIEKSIPYHIIFWIEFGDEFYISTSVKHLHPQNEDVAVIDYTFTSGWKSIESNNYQIELKNNLDWVFKNFCDQLKSIDIDTKSINELIEKQKINDAILKEIKKLKSEIERCKQFNKKVELNLKLKELQSIL
ncbi:DUF4391 domain-containing protein [Flavobacterium sp. CBA20B-1]|uniref:DUF4391 domain-containing protein n=1 Tax=unclassified Flavobacterium TaxID=196869 RepID=UPI00222476A1|nr:MULTISPECIES: DUF4391 domain-containing protein [unclassified Flavobacterium]WCM42543.1 DUF4391 domain-containing protein [Flavobacterium sp. CBA20B-1]